MLTDEQQNSRIMVTGGVKAMEKTESFLELYCIVNSLFLFEAKMAKY